MSKTMIFEGKTTNEAIEKGLKEFHVTKDKVDIKVLEKNKRSFFSILEPRIVKVEMTLKEEQEEVVKHIENVEQKKEFIQENITDAEINDIKSKVDKFVKELIQSLPSSDLEYNVEYDNYYIIVNISGKDVSYLIGYRGEVMNALQSILSAFISNNTKHRIRPIVDIGDYKEKRKRTLEELAVKTANTAVRTRRKITFEPMSSYERKIIHAKLQENNKIKTFSVGEEPYRKVVIAPK